MKAYHFRLERVAHLRRGQGVLARQAVARIVRQLEHAATDEAVSSRLYESFVTSEQPVESAAFLARFQQGERLAGAVVDAGRLRAERQHQLAQAREVASRAERNVAVLEKLDQRRRREWITQAQREDTAILDEFATVRAAARQKAER